MELEVSLENLAKALAIIKVPHNRSDLPILENVLIEAKKRNIRLSTTNLDIGITTIIGGKIKKEGTTSVSYRLLTEFINIISNQKIKFKLENNILKIKSKHSSAKLTTMDASDFPPFPKKESNAFTIPKDDILLIAKQVAFAASTDEGRPVLTGIIFKPVNGNLLVAATDGFRLSVKKFSSSYGQEEESIIPAKTLVEIARIKGEINESEDIEVFYAQGKNQLIFSFNDIDIFSRLIEGEYPNFEKIIPTVGKTKVIVDKEPFLRAIKAASLFARESANIVRILINKDGLIVSANTPQLGSGKTTLAADVSGEENQIAFNYRFLMDFLNSVNDEKIYFQMTNSLSPCLFWPKNDKSYQHVIMPVRVESEE